VYVDVRSCSRMNVRFDVRTHEGRAGVRLLVADTSQGPEAIGSLLSGLAGTAGRLWSQRHHETA